MEIKMGVNCTMMIMMIQFSGVWDAVILNDGEVHIGIEGAQDQLILQLIIHNTHLILQNPHSDFISFRLYFPFHLIQNTHMQ